MKPLKHMNPKINQIFSPLAPLQIAMLLLFSGNTVVRYAILMGIQKTIDSLGAESIQVTQRYLKLCAVLIAAFFLLNCFFQYWFRYLQYTSHYALMKGLFGMTIRKPISFHEKYPAASALTMIKDDSKFIANWKGIGMMTIVFNVFSLALAFGIMFYYNAVIAVVIGLIVIGCFVGTKTLTKAISDATYKLQESNTEISRRIVEYLGGIRDIRQYKKEEFFEKRLADYIDTHAYKYSRSISRYYSGFTSIYAMLAIALPMIAVLLGVVMILDGTMSIGELIAVYGIAGSLQEPVQTIPEFLNWHSQALALQDKIQPILNDEEETYSEESIGELDTFTFESEHYSFPDGKTILKDVGFRLRRGEPAIVKGPSGKGKTSLLNLVSRFYDTTDQPVRMWYNGAPVSRIKPDVYYDHVIQSQQTPYIFNDTVLENLTLGETFSEEEIDEAVRAACLEEFIEAKGFSYRIENNGENISGGQKQRLGLARALLRKPDLLLLDEPVSALNPEMAAAVTERVAQYCEHRNIALLLVSHNDSFERYYHEKGNGKEKVISV